MAEARGAAGAPRRAAVVGAGVMGAGIAQVLASAGVETVLVDTDAAALERAGPSVARAAGRAGAKAPVLSADVAAVSSCEAAIEAVTESLEAKRAVFAALDRALPPDAFIASNTSSLSIADLASATGRPALVAGMHFMNPPTAMKLVEVVRAPRTADETVRRVAALARVAGKVPVVVGDSPCFVVNRLLMPLVNEAARLVAEGVAAPEDVDAAMKLGANFPMGPLRLADLIGLDVVEAELRELERALGPAYSPSGEISGRVGRGDLGRKTGRGFFEYPGGAR
jgi:3-hydroxybutyryl-CoA dehydrogenase